MNDPPKVLTQAWFNTITFGDVVKLIILIAGGIMAFTRLSDGLDREGAMRSLLEAQTKESVMAIRGTQQENSARWDARYQETQVRDHEALTEMKAGLARLNDKLDGIIRQQVWSAKDGK